MLLPPFARLSFAIPLSMPIVTLAESRSMKYPLNISWKKNISSRLQQTATLRSRASQLSIMYVVRLSLSGMSS